MPHPSYGLPSSFSSDLSSWGYQKGSRTWANELYYERKLPAGNTQSFEELGVSRKRPRQDSFTNESSKRVPKDRLTFVPGTFRPVVILEDGDYSYPVVPRKIDRSGRSWDYPLVVEDGWENSAMAESSATNPHQKFRHVQRIPGRADATTRWTACKPSGYTPSLPNAWQESSLRSGPHLPEVNLQETVEHSNSAVRDLGISPTRKQSMWPTRRHHPYVPREHRSTSLPTSLNEAEDLVPPSTLQATEGENGAWSDNHPTTRKQRIVVKDNLPLRERKAFFIHTPTSALTSSMSKFVDEVYSALSLFRKEDECWLHPSPPRGRHKGCLSHIFCWTDESGRHKLDINFGIVALIVDSFLTEKQKEGWIMHSWHLSHLCGNWTCCNWRHFTVEPGRVNISRNACFMHRSGCVHEPKCMKEKKQRLSQIPSAAEPKTELYQEPQAMAEQHELSSLAKDWQELLTGTESLDVLLYP